MEPRVVRLFPAPLAAILEKRAFAERGVARPAVVQAALALAIWISGKLPRLCGADGVFRRGHDLRPFFAFGVLSKLDPSFASPGGDASHADGRRGDWPDPRRNAGPRFRLWRSRRRNDRHRDQRGRSFFTCSRAAYAVRLAVTKRA